MLHTLKLMTIRQAVEEARNGDDQAKKIDAALDAILELMMFLEEQERAARNESLLARRNAQTAIF